MPSSFRRRPGGRRAAPVPPALNASRGIVRAFSTAQIVTAGGAASGTGTSPMAGLVIFRTTSNAIDQELVQAAAADTSSVWSIEAISDGHLYATVGPGFRQMAAYAPNTWYLAGFQHATAGGQISGHLCDLAAATWTHADYGTLGDSASTVDHFNFGNAGGVGRLNGELALGAAYGHVIGNDAAWEALGVGLAAVVAAVPLTCWPFNLAAVADALVDIADSATQTASVDPTNQYVGPAVPNWSFDL